MTLPDVTQFPAATLLHNILVVAMDDEHGSTPFRADVLVEGDRIRAVGPDLVAPDRAEVIDGRDMLVMPGLVNAHLHSWEALFRGRYDNMPLELWMLLSYPVLGLTPLSERLVYLRTLLVGIESLKNGVTSLLDDVIESPTQSMAQLDAVFRAYGEIGIRANVSGNVVNRTFIDTLPYVDDIFDSALLARARRETPRDGNDYLAFSREALARWHGKDGLLRYVVAPSGPQRVTDELMVAADALSAEHDTTLHVHVLETKTQAVTGREFYGRTLIEHLSDLGVLSDRLTIAHGIWLTPHDIELLGAARVSVAHNAISNQKLGAGIAPLRALLDAGVNVALGSDGICSNDSARMFDVMKAAALLHKVTSPDYTTWPSAREVLWAATRGGARSVRLTDDVGAVAAGRKADLVVLDMRTVNFTPLNDVINHLVYCENGASVRTVMVNGRIVVRDGRCTGVDEDAVLAEIRELAPEVLDRHGEIEKVNQAFMPYLARIHDRCCAQAIGINRYSGNESGWVVSP